MQEFYDVEIKLYCLAKTKVPAVHASSPIESSMIHSGLMGSQSTWLLTDAELFCYL